MGDNGCECGSGSHPGFAVVDESVDGDVGWKHQPGMLSGYVEPFDTWSDMSDLIEREGWPVRRCAAGGVLLQCVSG